MGESACDYKEILRRVKSKLSCLLHFCAVCFLFDQLSGELRNNLHFKKSIARFETEQAFEEIQTVWI